MGFAFIGIFTLEVLSCMATVSVHSQLESLILEGIFKNGYKLSYDKCKDIDVDSLKFDHDIGRKGQTVLFFIPIVNYTFEKKLVKDVTEAFMNNNTLSKAIVPLTDIEKSIFNSITNKVERMNFMQTAMGLKEEQVITGYKDGKVNVHDNGLYGLSIERLTPLAYTYDEVLKLNKITLNKYKLCKVNDTNIAIIGVPNNIDEDVKRVMFMAERDSNIYPATSIEDPLDKHYLVYPFHQYNGLDDGVKQIKKEREFIRNQKEKRQ